MVVEAVDLFCGIGGLTKGVSNVGINVVAGIDNEEKCRATYENNNSALFLKKDITEMSYSEIKDLYEPNSIKILMGCAPCQPFSTYSNRYKDNNNLNKKRDLLIYFGEIIQNVQPEIVAMENVPELRKRDVYKTFLKILELNGYKVWEDIIYAPDYGVPQKRKRLVLLASKIENIEFISPLFNEDNYPTVRDYIFNLPLLKSGQRDSNDLLHFSSKLNEINLKRIRASKPNGTWRDWPDELVLKCHKKESGKSYPSVYGRMDWDSPAPTITTKFYGYGNGRFGHPEQDRALSLREGALLQTFPINYEFFSENGKQNTREIGIQIGNAVPVKLGEAIGISIIDHLRKAGIGVE